MYYLNSYVISYRASKIAILCMSQFPYCQHDLFPYDDKSIFQISFGLDLSLGLCSLFGFGILAYGICYFLIHDVYIHRRFKWFRDIDHPYFYAIRKAHKIHHKYRGKEDGECFGMLVVPYKFYKEAKITFERRGLKK